MDTEIEKKFGTYTGKICVKDLEEILTIEPKKLYNLMLCGKFDCRKHDDARITIFELPILGDVDVTITSGGVKLLRYRCKQRSLIFKESAESSMKMAIIMGIVRELRSVKKLLGWEWEKQAVDLERKLEEKNYQTFCKVDFSACNSEKAGSYTLHLVEKAPTEPAIAAAPRLARELVAELFGA